MFKMSIILISFWCLCFVDCVFVGIIKPLVKLIIKCLLLSFLRLNLKNTNIRITLDRDTLELCVIFARETLQILETYIDNDAQRYANFIPSIQLKEHQISVR